jgi:predicted aspartyl protease
MRPASGRQIAQEGLFLSFVLTVATSGFSQTPSVPRSEPSNVASAGRYEIPFQTYRGYLIVVQGSLGDTQGLNFIIDTGTDPSVIDSRAAEKLQMARTVGKLAVHNRIVEVQQAVLPSVQIGALRAEFRPVLVQDLAFLQKGLGIRVDAVIGLDVLSLSNFSIDYTTKRIVFGAVPLSGSAAPFERTEFSLTVGMEVDGVSVHLLLDTGASGILLFQSRIRDRLPHLISLGERTSENMGGGEFQLKQVLLATTKLGKTDFGRQSAFVVEDQEGSSGDFDGLLGTSALGLKQIAFDFQRHTFSWKR